MVFAGGWDNEASDLIMSVGDVLEGPNGARHIVLDSLGQGTFGQVGVHGRERAGQRGKLSHAAGASQTHSPAPPPLPCGAPAA